jgi:hypothetical protein
MPITVKTIAEQTGFRRAMPATLCQNFDLLCQVTEYDFDLSNIEFQHYAKCRGVLHLAGRNSRWDFTADHHATKEQFLEQFCLAEPDQITGARYQFSDDEMETHWRIMLAAKGAMQDCWELWNKAR